MLLTVQIFIICVLLFTLISVYVDELRDMKKNAPHAIVDEIWLNKERRDGVRVKLELDAVYSHPPEKMQKAAKKTYVENISIGGAKIQVEEKLVKGEKLLLEIRLPNTVKPIYADAETVWINDNPKTSPSGRRRFEAGVQFARLKPAERQELSSFIQKTLNA